MEITEAKIIAFLKDMERSCDVRFVTNNMIPPLEWHGDVVNRTIPKVRKVLKRMADKGSIDQFEHGNGYRFKYISPEEQAEREQARQLQEERIAYLRTIFAQSGVPVSQLDHYMEDYVVGSHISMPFHVFFRVIKGIKES